MRARLLYMMPEVRKVLGIYLYQIFDAKEIKIFENGWKYPRQTKQIYCNKKDGKHIMFYWYEVELLNNQS